jgi:hypothetical protein
MVCRAVRNSNHTFFLRGGAGFHKLNLAKIPRRFNAITHINIGFAQMQP